MSKYQDKTPANWVQTVELGDGVSVSLSENGGFKITDGQTMNGRDNILMFGNVKNLERLQAAFMSLQPETIEKFTHQASLGKEQKKVNAEMEKHANRAKQGVQALVDIAKAKGLDPQTYIAQILTGKVG